MSSLRRLLFGAKREIRRAVRSGCELDGLEKSRVGAHASAEFAGAGLLLSVVNAAAGLKPREGISAPLLARAKTERPLLMWTGGVSHGGTLSAIRRMRKAGRDYPLVGKGVG